MTPMADPSTYARSFGQVCRALDEQPDVDALLDHIAGLVLGCAEAADHVAVSVLRHRRLGVEAATSETAADLETAQIAANEGPSPSATRTLQPEAVADWEAETRWPQLRTAALAAGIRAVRAYPLTGRRGILGVVTLYAGRPAAFDPGEDEWLGDLLIPCGIAVGSALLEADLRLAVQSRDVIGQAKGILMERHRASPDEAFQLLVAMSQSSHRKLHDVAEELARTGSVS